MVRPDVQRFESASGIRVYRLPIQALPNLIVYAHLVLWDQHAVLVDVGSGIGESTDHLLAGFAAVRERFGERITPADLTRIVITHGHIDHFGGLLALREQTDAPVGIHPLDLPVLQNFEERLALMAYNLNLFLQRAGVRATRRDELLTLYTATKYVFRSTSVDFLIDVEAEPLDGLFRFFHVPGHCPGQVSIQVDDILLSADHILARITPHQSPESIARSNGLGHYLDSLKTVEHLPGIRLVLGGHEAPLTDLPGRVAEIRASHTRRLDQIVGLCEQPLSILEISRQLFGKLGGYDVILGLTEVGAHVEYLHERGRLSLANLDAAMADPEVALQYKRVSLPSF